MSKNIIIQEGGVNKSLNSIKKILTDEQDGGSCNWIPEDEAERGTKTITKNGTYKASDDDLYGYSKVVVNIAGSSGGSPSSSGSPGSSITGKDPDDENENEYEYKVDDNGNVQKTKLPTRIAVTKNPDKTSYESGQTLNPSGIIVHAYYADGGDYGTVLNSELTFEPMTVATVDGEIYTKDGVNALAVHADEHVSFTNLSGYKSTSYLAMDGGLYRFHAVGDPNVIVYYTKYNGKVYIATNASRGGLAIYMTSDENGTNRSAYSGYGVSDSGANYRFALASNFINNLAASTPSGLLLNIPESSVDPTTVDFSDASTLTMKITVKWNRPADDKVLTTTFDVNVSPSTGEESGGGGSHGF